jgi:hypothetical protein
MRCRDLWNRCLWHFLLGQRFAWITRTGVAVFGHSCSGTGVHGQSVKSGCGVLGESIGGPGVKGVSSTAAGVRGCSNSSYGLHGVSSTGPGVYGNSNSCYGVEGKSATGAGVFGCSTSSYGVQGQSLGNCGRHVGVVGYTGYGAGSAGVAGYALGGTRCCTPGVTAGVFGESQAYNGQGVSGSASGCGCSVGVIGQAGSRSGIGVLGLAKCIFTVPVVARGASGQSGPLMEWQNNVGTPLSVINSNGWLGIGTTSPVSALEVVGPSATTVPIIARGASGQTAPFLELQKSCGKPLTVIDEYGNIGIAINGSTKPTTTLQVGGGISLKIATVTANYSMKVSDYAILANATSAALTVTLPHANTA